METEYVEFQCRWIKTYARSVASRWTEETCPLQPTFARDIVPEIDANPVSFSGSGLYSFLHNTANAASVEHPKVEILAASDQGTLAPSLSRGIDPCTPRGRPPLSDHSPRSPFVSTPVTDPKTLKGGGRQFSSPRAHLSQMHTLTIYMPFTRKKAAFGKKYEPIGGRPPPFESATGPPNILTWRRSWRRWSQSLYFRRRLTYSWAHGISLSLSQS